MPCGSPSWRISVLAWRWHLSHAKLPERSAARLAVCNAGLGLAPSLLTCTNLARANISIGKLLVNLDVRSCKFTSKLDEVATFRTHAFVRQ